MKIFHFPLKIFVSSKIFEEFAIFEDLRRIFELTKILRLRLRSIFRNRRIFVFVFGPFSIFVATLLHSTLLINATFILKHRSPVLIINSIGTQSIIKELSQNQEVSLGHVIERKKPRNLPTLTLTQNWEIDQFKVNDALNLQLQVHQPQVETRVLEICLCQKTK